MQANRGVARIAITSTLLKVGRLVFEKNESFPKRLKNRFHTLS